MKTKEEILESVEIWADDAVLEAMQAYADQQKQQIIKVIEDRIAELEKHQSGFKPSNETYQQLGFIIIDYRKTIKLIK